MNSEQQIELIDSLMKNLRSLKSNIKAKDKKNDRILNSSLSHKQAQKATADLNFHCMYLDQNIVDIARLFKGSFLDVSTEPRIYRPSGFHEYKY